MITSPDRRPHRPLLLISASDSSGAAGMQVDLRTADSLGMAARCAVTALTIQGDRGVVEIKAVPPPILRNAVRTALSDRPGIGAVKIGMLVNREVTRTVGGSLKELNGGCPIVLDPVLRSTSGHELLTRAGIKALLEGIVPHSAIVTPNREELRVLGAALGCYGPEADLAAALLGTGTGAVLVTGGEGGEGMITDVLYTKAKGREFTHRRRAGPTPRGTGCALATAIACFLARNRPLVEAVSGAIDHVQNLIRSAKVIGSQRLLFPTAPAGGAGSDPRARGPENGDG